MSVCMCLGFCFFLLFFFLFRSVCILSVLLHLCTSKHPPLIFTKSPRLYKVFLSAWSSVWMKVTKLTSLFLKKEKKNITAHLEFCFSSVKFWSKVSVVFFFPLILKNSLKIGFIVGCCFRVLFCFFYSFFFCIFFFFQTVFLS